MGLIILSSYSVTLYRVWISDLIPRTLLHATRDCTFHFMYTPLYVVTSSRSVAWKLLRTAEVALSSGFSNCPRALATATLY
jgi:hypothetical protein